MTAETAGERIARWRQHYDSGGEPVGHLSDLELALRELDATETNRRSVQAQHDRMLHEQSQHERDVQTAARAAVEGARRAWAETYMSHLLSQYERPIRELAYRSSQVGSRVGKDQLDGLHQRAREVAEMLKQPMQPEELKVAEGWRAEAWRLREYVMAAGRALHAEFGEAGVGCHCCGCELIRGMDDVEVPADGAA